MSHELVEAMAGMKEQEALDLAKKMLDGGEDPLKVLDLCREAVEVVGTPRSVSDTFSPDWLAGMRRRTTHSPLSSLVYSPPWTLRSVSRAVSASS